MKKEDFCPKCDGEGGKEVSVESSSNDFDWISDGEYMSLGWKECKACKGTGKIIKKDKKNG